MSGPKYTEADYEKVMAMPAERYSLRDVGRATGVSMSAADRMRRGEWQPPTGPSMPLLGRSRLTDVITDYVGGGGHHTGRPDRAGPCNDPFRQDTTEGHKNGQWLRDTLESMGVEVGEGGRKIHNRGLHYLLLGLGQAGRLGVPELRVRVEMVERPGEQGGPVARVRPVHLDHRPAQRRAGSSRWRPSGSARWRKGTAGDGLPDYGM
jgi:hypothetical protein